MLYDSLIENNIVVVNSTHHITWAGLRDSTIINNTLSWNPNIATYNWGRIIIANTKPPLSYTDSGNTIRNNLCTGVELEPGDDRETVDHNLYYVSTVDHFVDYENENYTLKETSTAINAGSATLAPLTDYSGFTRTGLPDIGAYEYVSAGDVIAPQSPSGLAVW